MIYVKARMGRKAYVESQEIPNDKFVPVPDNNYTRRLIHVWEDLEVGDKPTQAKS